MTLKALPGETTRLRRRRDLSVRFSVDRSTDFAVCENVPCAHLRFLRIKSR
jgi:hypothetical protein